MANVDAIERFWSKVDKAPGLGPNGDCWQWKAAKMPKGYGRIGWGPHCYNTSAAHVSLELAGRPRPKKDAQSLHSCDWPPCVNPAHLSWGSHADNMVDRLSRGRSIKCGKKGEANKQAKLTAKMVRIIRSSPLPVSRLAVLCNVSKSAIYQIKQRKTWKEIT